MVQRQRSQRSQRSQKSRRSQRSQRSQKSQRSQSQRGGSPNYSFTGPAGNAAGGVPFESRAANNENCGWNLRPAPQMGGGCGCMAAPPMSSMNGGGGGNGGHGFTLDNSLGKVYAALPVGPCPAQAGGATDAQLRGIDSFPAGYALDRPVNTPSANYLDYTGYGRSCMGGARKSRSRKSQKSKKSQKNKKSQKSKSQKRR